MTIRRHSQTPIIMLSAKGEVFDKVLGLELGADDYIIQAFDSKEPGGPRQGRFSAAPL